MPEGRLVFTCLKAVNLKNAQTFGKQDPYLDVKVGRINYRGKTITDGGTSPVVVSAQCSSHLLPPMHTVYARYAFAQEFGLGRNPF